MHHQQLEVMELNRTKCLIIIEESVLIVEQVIHVVNHYQKRQQAHHVITSSYQFQNIFPVY
jgi:hypothetical protein